LCGVAIVEDDVVLARAIGTYLNGRDYEVGAYTGYTGSSRSFKAKQILL
jgi:hypothetical protein